MPPELVLIRSSTSVVLVLRVSLPDNVEIVPRASYESPIVGCKLRLIVSRRGCVLDLYRWSSRNSPGIARMLDRDRLPAWDPQACRTGDSPSISASPEHSCQTSC